MNRRDFITAISTVAGAVAAGIPAAKATPTPPPGTQYGDYVVLYGVAPTKAEMLEDPAVEHAVRELLTMFKQLVPPGEKIGVTCTPPSFEFEWGTVGAKWPSKHADFYLTV